MAYSFEIPGMTRAWRSMGIAMTAALTVTALLHGQATPRALGTRSDSLTIAMRVPGCYVLREGPWATAYGLAAFYPPASIPRRFQFDTVRIIGWDAMQEAERPMLRVRTNVAGPFTYWQQRNRSLPELYVGAPLPLGGASLRLHPVLEGLAGDLTTFTDAIPAIGMASATAPVLLQTVPCAES